MRTVIGIADGRRSFSKDRYEITKLFFAIFERNIPPEVNIFKDQLRERPSNSQQYFKKELCPILKATV